MKTLRRYGFILPTILLVFAFAVYPALQTVRLSLMTPAGQFDPLRNYAEVLSARRVLDPGALTAGRFPMGALAHTFIWIVFCLLYTSDAADE